MSGTVRAAIERLMRIGDRPDDDADTRHRKHSLTLSSCVITVLAAGWVGMYAALGLWAAAAIPFAYQVVSLASIASFARTKHEGFFSSSQRLLSLLLPFALQWTLGGLVASSAVSMWALLAPLGSLIFDGRAKASGWFLAYAFLTILSGAVEPALAAHAAAMPSAVRAAFWGMNLICPTGIAFGILFSSDRERMQARDALRAEHALVVEEHDRSERLLLNILPQPIATRLKASPAAIADGYPEVTVLFSDVVSFTTLSARITPEQLVAFLNEVFTLIDHIADRHGLEKIKTIGDAYMAAAGLPEPRPDHAEAAAEMALDMRDGIRNMVAPTGEPLRMRIGINTGPVVAGVIGRRKFIYDLWGDAVNLASRMESHGVADAVHCSESTYLKLKDRYRFEERGEIEVKGKGKLRTYLLLGRT